MTCKDVKAKARLYISRCSLESLCPDDRCIREGLSKVEEDLVKEGERLCRCYSTSRTLGSSPLNRRASHSSNAELHTIGTRLSCGQDHVACEALHRDVERRETEDLLQIKIQTLRLNAKKKSVETHDCSEADSLVRPNLQLAAREQVTHDV